MQNIAVRLSACYLHVNASFHRASKWSVRYSVKLGKYLHEVRFPMTLKQQPYSQHTNTRAHTLQVSVFKRVKFGQRVSCQSRKLGPMMKVCFSEREEKQNVKEKQQNNKPG